MDRDKRKKDNDPGTDGFEDVLALLKDGWEKLDANDSAGKPDPWVLRQELDRHKRDMRRKTYQDLGLFLGSAVVVLSASIVVYMNLPELFLPIQAAAAAAGPLFWVIRSGKARRDRKVERE